MSCSRFFSPRILRTLGLVTGLFLLGSATIPAGNAVELLAFLRAAPGASIDDADSEAPPASSTPAPHKSREAIERESHYDPGNPDLAKLQRIQDATGMIPFDVTGFPDWMGALRSGKITPRASLTGKEPMKVLDLDIIMRNTKEMPNVRFPHSSHTMWLDCSNCHPYPFQAKAGSTTIQMADIFRGQYCGMCHDRVAFITFFACTRCHSVQPKAATEK